MAVPRGVSMHLPTDLAGVTKVEYNPLRTDGNTQAAVGALCTRVKQAMGKTAKQPQADERLRLDLPATGRVAKRIEE